MLPEQAQRPSRRAIFWGVLRDGLIVGAMLGFAWALAMLATAG